MNKYLLDALWRLIVSIFVFGCTFILLVSRNWGNMYSFFLTSVIVFLMDDITIKFAYFRRHFKYFLMGTYPNIIEQFQDILNAGGIL